MQNTTTDGKHPKFGDDSEDITMPPGFTAPDQAATCSQWSGRDMEAAEADDVYHPIGDKY